MGRANRFDSKFGVEFIESVPLCPGVYQAFDGDGKLIYVGKARRLRRRLQQYRNAKRCKKNRKMRAILADACRIVVTECASDLEALLLENRLIQQFRPRYNIAGAFSFLYPVILLKRTGKDLALAYSTSPAEFSGFANYGAFRSRYITKEAFLALVRLLEDIGHREPFKKLKAYPRVKYSQLTAFRQINDAWFELIETFLAGQSIALLENIVLALVEKASARKRATEVQEDIHALERFFRLEAEPLRRMLKTLDRSQDKFIAQEERDRIFLQAKHVIRTTRLERASGVAPF